MPARMALMPVSGSALPSKGRITMISTFLLISVSTWLICWLTSLVPSTASSVTSSYLAAWLLALAVMAPIQPWSAWGAEKPMTSAFPFLSLPPPVLTFAAWLPFAASGSSLLLVQPASTAPAPRAPAPIRKPRRARVVGVWGMVCPPELSGTIAVRAHEPDPGAAEPRSGARRRVTVVGSRAGPSTGVPLGGCLPTGPALQQHGGDDDQALRDVLDLGRQVVEDEDVGDGREAQHAKERADDRAASTAQQRAADDDGGDGVELVQVAVGARPGGRAGDEHDGGDAAAQPGEHVQQGGVPAYVDAGEAGGLGVAADGERAPAEGRAVEQHPACSDDDGQHHDEERDPQDVGRRDLLDGRRLHDLG